VRLEVIDGKGLSVEPITWTLPRRISFAALPEENCSRAEARRPNVTLYAAINGRSSTGVHSGLEKKRTPKEYDFRMSTPKFTPEGVLAANLPVRRLKGLIRKPGKTVSIEEMNIAISKRRHALVCPMKW